VQGVGEIKIKLHRPISGKIKTVSVKREGQQWYACFSVECEPKPLPALENEVGIDVGLESFAALSNGKYIPNPRWYRTAEAVRSPESFGRAQHRSPRASRAWCHHAGFGTASKVSWWSSARRNRFSSALNVNVNDLAPPLWCFRAYPKEWMQTSFLLWDFVDFRIRNICFSAHSKPNSHPFIRLIQWRKPAHGWHPVCSTQAQQKQRLASRGGQNPTSTGILVLGGQFKKKGACTSPLFRSSVVISSFPRVSLGRLHATRRTAVLRPSSDHESSKLTPKLRSVACWRSGLQGQRAKKVSGQWGDRPLGRAMEPWSEVSSTLLYPAQGGEQAVPLRSRAAVRRTGADTR
jgi:hypothetical protein